MERKYFELLVKVSKNRRWLGIVGETVTYSSEDKVESQERSRGFVNFGKEGEVFSRASGGRVENIVLQPL